MDGMVERNLSVPPEQRKTLQKSRVRHQHNMVNASSAHIESESSAHIANESSAHRETASSAHKQRSSAHIDAGKQPFRVGVGGVGGVGWDDNVHVPMHTQAQQPHHLSSRRAETGTALSWSVTGGVGWVN